MSIQPDYSDLYSEVMPSVASIYVDAPDGDDPGRGAGSGFVYDDDYLVTNQHVLAPPSASGPRRGREPPGSVGTAVEEVSVRFDEGDWRTARVVGSDPHTDLAVVRVEDAPGYARPLPVAGTSPEPGTPVAALGTPLGLDGSITSGIVSGANRSMPTGGGFVLPDTVQTDAPINPGNSGGPLVAADTPEAVVVGVNRARQGDNIGFAVSPEIVERVVPALATDGEYRHPYLRIRTLDVTPVVAEANGLDETRGSLVVDVPLGPASAALRECTVTKTVRGREVPVGGDVVVGIESEPVDAHEQLMRHLVVECEPGETVPLTVIRDGAEETVTVELAERPPPGGGIPVR